MESIYKGFEDYDDMLSQFQLEESKAPPPEAILCAEYDTWDYEGEAFVLYRDMDNGKLYEVNGGHCSCYGLEGQWEPEEADVAELLSRPALRRFPRAVEALRSILREVRP